MEIPRSALVLVLPFAMACTPVAAPDASAPPVCESAAGSTSTTPSPTDWVPSGDEVFEALTPGPSLDDPRSGFAVVTLPDGRVLVTGGWRDVGLPLCTAEAFDPATGRFVRVASTRRPHGAHTTCLTAGGRVLLVPGYGAGTDRDIAEIYDPATGGWSDAPGPGRALYVPVSAPLPNGDVLVVDGTYNRDREPARVFEAARGGWRETPPVAVCHPTVTLTALADGRVLMVGRGSPIGFRQIGRSIACVFDTATNAWTEVSAPSDVRISHTATRLRDGRVLVAGGAFFKPTCEIFDPEKGAWSTVATTDRVRSADAATLLPDGRVLVIGDSAEVYDPEANRWRAALPRAESRVYHQAVTLADGRVLVIGGTRPPATVLDACECYRLER